MTISQEELQQKFTNINTALETSLKDAGIDRQLLISLIKSPQTALLSNDFYKDLQSSLLQESEEIKRITRIAINLYILSLQPDPNGKIKLGMSNKEGQYFSFVFRKYFKSNENFYFTKCNLAALDIHQLQAFCDIVKDLQLSSIIIHNAYLPHLDQNQLKAFCAVITDSSLRSFDIGGNHFGEFNQETKIYQKLMIYSVPV